jgi:shikimate dehydrogenase
LVGDPVDADMSALIHRYWLHKVGLDADYRTRKIPAGHLMDGLSHLRDHLARTRDDPQWRGCSVQSPLKEAAAALVDRKRPMAARLGSVDLVIRDGRSLVGCNSAAIGFMAPLLGHISALPSRRALLIGAGCRARTIAHMLDDFGLSLVIANRHIATARRLVNELGRGDRHSAITLDDAAALPRDVALLVNATPLGAAGKAAFPVELKMLLPGAIVYDLVRDPVDTCLLRDARARDLVMVNGLEMVVAQAALSFEGLFGVRAPREYDNQLRLLITP